MTPSSVTMIAALQLVLYRGAEIAAYTPSPIFLISNSSLSAVSAYAGMAQQISCGSRV